MAETKKPKRKLKIFKIVLKTLGVILGLYLLLEIIAFHMIPVIYMHRPKQFCQYPENDAHGIAAAISDYFSNPEHLSITRSDIEALITVENPWTLRFDAKEIVIRVSDKSGRCPAEYQDARLEWESGVYTLRIRIEDT